MLRLARVRLIVPFFKQNKIKYKKKSVYRSIILIAAVYRAKSAL